MPESQGQNLALTVLYLPCSLSGECVAQHVIQGYLHDQKLLPPSSPGPPQGPRHAPTVGPTVGSSRQRIQNGSSPKTAKSDFFMDNLLVRIHFIIAMIRWTGLAPWELEFPFPGSLTSTFLCLSVTGSRGASLIRKRYRGTSLIRVRYPKRQTRRCWRPSETFYSSHLGTSRRQTAPFRARLRT